MHGESLGLTIAGLNIGQIVEVKVPVTEVLYPVTGNTGKRGMADANNNY
jgi:hypothetical protein